MSLDNMLALAIGVVPVAAPFLGALYKLLVSNLPAVKVAQVERSVRSAVVAAEQVYKDIPGSSQAKREWVISRVQALFGKRVNAALVEVLLEEAVAALPKSSLLPNPHSAI